MTSYLDTEISTKIGRANTERVTLRGYDLVTEVMGRMSFTEAALLAITGARPTSGQVRVADAVLVTFIDHGMQPSALVTRLIHSAAPEAVQGAVAAGLLGVGSRILGTMEQTAQLLDRIAAVVADGEDEQSFIAELVAGERAAGRHIPGVGHTLHRQGDPRAAPLIAVAQQENVGETELARLQRLVDEASRVAGRPLPANAAGVSAALLLGIGVPSSLQRGMAMISRTAGLVAHVGEEAIDPVAPAVRTLLRKSSWLEDQ